MNEPKIIDFPGLMVVGMNVTAPLSMETTVKLWSEFMPRKREVRSIISPDLYAIREYQNMNPVDMKSGNVKQWAGAPVKMEGFVPKGMDLLVIDPGLYAVFTHHGKSDRFSETVAYAFTKWLPESGYKLDLRPHFERMGKDYLGADNEHSVEYFHLPISKV